VKYKNLAHVHNRWIPEGDIIDSTQGAHNLVSKFSKKIQKEKVVTLMIFMFVRGSC
jgi:chromodomain-helicase-DNA-binding protein 3